MKLSIFGTKEIDEVSPFISLLKNIIRPNLYRCQTDLIFCMDVKHIETDQVKGLDCETKQWWSHSAKQKGSSNERILTLATIFNQFFNNNGRWFISRTNTKIALIPHNE